jgi:hypothetical protein
LALASAGTASRATAASAATIRSRFMSLLGLMGVQHGVYLLAILMAVGAVLHT